MSTVNFSEYKEQIEGLTECIATEAYIRGKEDEALRIYDCLNEVGHLNDPLIIREIYGKNIGTPDDIFMSFSFKTIVDLYTEYQERKKEKEAYESLRSAVEVDLEDIVNNYELSYETLIDIAEKMRKDYQESLF